LLSSSSGGEKDALISAETAEIRQIEPFAVRFARGHKSAMLYGKKRRFAWPPYA
jgi:hypothetical protein